MAFAPATPPSATAGHGADSGRFTDYPTAMASCTVIFFMWGFLTSLNDILIPHLKALFGLNYSQAMLVQSLFFGAFFLMAVPAGKLVERIGFKFGMVSGLLVAGVGAAMFWPAAQWQNYDLFLAAFFVLATGITVLQVAANPYVSLLGPERTASSRLTLAQTLNSLGTIIGPKLGGIVILGTILGTYQLSKLDGTQMAAYRVQQAQLVQLPYLVLAALLVLLALFVWWVRLPSRLDNVAAADSGHSLWDALRVPHVAFAVVAIFCYVGAEVSIGSFMISYLSQPQIGNLSETHAADYVAYYWGGAMLGRFIGTFLLARFNPRKLLALFALIAGALVVTSMSSTHALAMYSIVAVGLFNSIMFPTIFALGIERLGPLTDKASSLLVMAIVGGAVIPKLQGILADRIGIQHAFVLPLLCYAYIVFYGRRESKVRANPAAQA